jgi:DNA-binding transcriptional LysR family regulator
MDRIDAMALFVAAIDAGSLSGAARAHGLSLSAVSRNLTALEERIGTRLVVRSTRRLALTEAGHTYYEKAKQLLAEIDELETALTLEASVPAGRLTVSGPILFGRAFLLPVLADYAVRYPQVVLDLLLLDRRVNPIEEGIDLAVHIGELDDSSLIVRRLGSLRWVVSGSPGYFEAHGVPEHPADLASHRCLVFTGQGSGPNWPLQAGGKPLTQAVPESLRSNTLDGVVSAALAGVGLCQAPVWAIAEHVAQGRLRVALRAFELPPRPINAVFTHNRLLSGKVRTALDLLTERLRAMDFDALPEPDPVP